jgi:hypothetical protein
MDAAPMIIALDRTGTLEGFRDTLLGVARAPEVTTLLVLAADGNDHVPATTDPVLRAARKPVFGGVFPQIVHGREHLERGTLVIGIAEHVHATIVRGVSDDALDLDRAVAGAIDPSAGDALLVVLVDGFSRRIGELVNALFQEFGLTMNYLGGGAGSLSMVQRPCLFTAEGMLQDAALLLQVARPNGVGVSHGWQVVSEPLKVTRAEHTTVLELNHEPALDVYRRIVEPLFGKPFDVADFFEIAKGFPFGIRKLDAEVVVRDPVVIAPGGGLVCVGEVPEGAFVHVLRGESSRLVDAARHAGELARTGLAGRGTPRLRVLIDCISRVLFLGDGFGAELAAVDAGDVPMVGALTIGEIANNGSDFLEFYNKTAVVGLFGDA